jgi:hypothetical protein
VAIRTTQWKPDTCGCVAVYSWDDAVPDAQRVHTLVSLDPCPAHAGLATNLARFDAVNDENSRKNLAKAEILAKVAALSATVINLDGSTSVDFARPPAISFGSMNGKGRTLILTIPGLTVPQRTAAQSACDLKFGVGKVVVQ